MQSHPEFAPKLHTWSLYVEALAKGLQPHPKDALKPSLKERSVAGRKDEVLAQLRRKEEEQGLAAVSDPALLRAMIMKHIEDKAAVRAMYEAADFRRNSLAAQSSQVQAALLGQLGQLQEALAAVVQAAAPAAPAAAAASSASSASTEAAAATITPTTPPVPATPPADAQDPPSPPAPHAPPSWEPSAPASELLHRACELRLATLRRQFEQRLQQEQRRLKVLDERLQKALAAGGGAMHGDAGPLPLPQAPRPYLKAATSSPRKK